MTALSGAPAGSGEEPTAIDAQLVADPDGSFYDTMAALGHHDLAQAALREPEGKGPFTTLAQEIIRVEGDVDQIRDQVLADALMARGQAELAQAVLAESDVNGLNHQLARQTAFHPGTNEVAYGGNLVD